MPSRNVRPRLLGGILAGALLLSSCMSGGGNQADATAQRGGKAEIRVASAETDAKAMAALTAAGKAYEAKTGTKVTFEAIPLNDIYTKVNAASGTNAEYDAFLTGFIGHISLFQGEG
jgi:multiple sugar transport system substrate-binding protein